MTELEHIIADSIESMGDAELVKLLNLVEVEIHCEHTEAPTDALPGQV